MSVANNICSSAVIHTGADSSKYIHEFQKALADNTHFNPYGAYEIAKMVAAALAQSEMPIGAFVLPEFSQFDPSHPDAFETFHWNNCPFVDMTKPDGN